MQSRERAPINVFVEESAARSVLLPAELRVTSPDKTPLLLSSSMRWLRAGMAEGICRGGFEVLTLQSALQPSPALRVLCYLL